MNTRRPTLSSSSLPQVEFLSSRCWRFAVVSSLLFLIATAPAQAQGFPVTVIEPGNAPLPLTVEATNVIQDLKQQIFVARGYPVAQQVLVHDGSRRADTSTVADNNISTNDLLYLTLDVGVPLNISSFSIDAGTMEIVATQMTAGITQIIEQSPSLPSPAVWMNAAEDLATSVGTNWTLAMPLEAEPSFYRIRERDPRPPVTQYPGYELAWHDEFEGPGINTTNWWHQLGDGTLYGLNPGWGNAELQIYTNAPENSSIVGDNEGNSVLLIEAIKGVYSNDYTSARLVTDGLQSVRFGRIEARIRLPYSQGAFPAFWMLGTNQPVVNWPGCGEIDIMEMLGSQEDEVHGHAIYVDVDHELASTGGTATNTLGLFSDDYHIYGIDWTPTNMTWSVDGVAYHTAPINADMKEFQRGFYLLLNLAVGGSWLGYPDASSEFPMRMFVDYVRVYRDLSLVDPGEPPLDIDEETLNSFLFDASDAIQEGFTPFENVDTVVYGVGGTPVIEPSTNAVDGVWSVQASYPDPGFGWGGGMYFELASPADMSAYANGNLVVALKVPGNLTDFEVKLESPGGLSGSVNLFDYTPVPINADFAEYTIPLADFTAQNFVLSNVSIPFALWNPKDASGSVVAAEVLIDNIHFALP
jgi:beta-glucanase (GH16 family)